MKALLSLLFTLSFALCASERPKPNVILILADDLGWQDVKCYDIDKPSPYETPHIDQLSKDGIMFWQAYSPAPTCAPSRGAILAGKHPVRLKRPHVVGGAPPIPNHEKAWSMIAPWYRGRLPISNIIIPEVLKTNGYYTGHVGKWHIAIDHHAYPQPKDHGFDFTRSDRGATGGSRKDRLSDFATTAKDDPYRLDENNFPFHQNNVDALNFIQDNKAKPFFLYYATWLVHTPIHTRSRPLLEKYCKKIGIDFPTDPKGWTLPGQQNPYYAAMIEMLDYYLGQVITSLKETDDPRWPGHKLIENTYIIFTSDNGGMEGHPGEVITDNYPLDKGKINAQEGGTRVPFIISGPMVPKAVQTNVIANGMDLFPTILSWTKTKKPTDLQFDGSDLSSLITNNPQDPNLIKEANGEVRNSVMHHFPNSASMHSTLRIDGWKIIRNYQPNKAKIELYQLYDDSGKRVDIEESKNLVSQMPEKAAEMNRLLQQRLDEMDADYPYKNPYFKNSLAGKKQVPIVTSQEQNGRQLSLNYENKGNALSKAYLMYTLNGGQQSEEWYRMDAQIQGNKVNATLPEGSTHYIFNLIDDQNFLVSYPRMGQVGDFKRGNYSIKALKVK
ncbi:sulfatase [Lentisphaera profundi]|uniref:Sulfatase n=1 Tax=Lentisphaera profundi TaxID=1658616 RepID=A0ABY7W048_9BACT|nr:sulfatase [Lentisphaera profundi]WDE99439.1 sulfatase [Lentisphaera profundi]